MLQHVQWAAHWQQGLEKAQVKPTRWNSLPWKYLVQAGKLKDWRHRTQSNVASTPTPLHCHCCGGASRCSWVAESLVPYVIDRADLGKSAIFGRAVNVHTFVGSGELRGAVPSSLYATELRQRVTRGRVHVGQTPSTRSAHTSWACASLRLRSVRVVVGRVTMRHGLCP